MFNGDRVSLLQDEESSWDLLHSNVHALNSPELYCTVEITMGGVLIATGILQMGARTQ